MHEFAEDFCTELLLQVCVAGYISHQRNFSLVLDRVSKIVHVGTG